MRTLPVMLPLSGRARGSGGDVCGGGGGIVDLEGSLRSHSAALLWQALRYQKSCFLSTSTSRTLLRKDSKPTLAIVFLEHA